MPFYEYVCQNCGVETEILQKISDAPETHCPSCNAESLVKHVSAAGFRLKGGGWYETDFKSAGKKNLTGEDAGKPESKPEGADKSCSAGACPACTPAGSSSPSPSPPSSTPGPAPA